MRSAPPPWRLVFACVSAAAGFYLAGLQWSSIIPLAIACRTGPLNRALCALPEVHSKADFDNRSYRVWQSLWLVSICCALYTLIPEDKTEKLEGWKMNLVTMETSMSSGIAATYGYSVAGGVPGGLLAEYVMSSLGRATVLELAPYVGDTIARSGVSFVLFMTMGSFMDFCAQTACASLVPPHQHALRAARLLTQTRVPCRRRVCAPARASNEERAT